MTSTYAVVQPELADQLAEAGAPAQRQVVLALAMLILSEVSIENGGDALQALRTGGFGDTPVRRALERTAWAAASRAEDLSEREAADRDGIWSAEPELSECRRLARAAETLVFALSADAHKAAQECAYLTRFVIGPAEVDDVVRAILVGQP